MAKESNSTIARALLADINAGKPAKEVAVSLAAYLIEERRLGDVNAILRDVERQLMTSQAKLYIHAETAHALVAQQIAEITQIFQAETGAKEVIIQETINTDVIGGVRLTTADQQLDLTVRRQLQRLKNQTT